MPSTGLNNICALSFFPFLRLFPCKTSIGKSSCPDVPSIFFSVCREGATIMQVGHISFFTIQLAQVRGLGKGGDCGSVEIVPSNDIFFRGFAVHPFLESEQRTSAPKAISSACTEGFTWSQMDRRERVPASLTVPVCCFLSRRKKPAL